MTSGDRARGYALFLLLVLVAGAAAAFAFAKTGSQGSEERVASAVGLSGEKGLATGDHGSGGGIPLEGNPVLYLGVLLVLVTGCALVYRRYRLE